MSDGSSGDLWLHWLLVLIWYSLSFSACQTVQPTMLTLYTSISEMSMEYLPMWQALVPLCAQWRVWSKNLPGGVSSTTSSHCRKIYRQQAAWLSEGGDQHYRMRTTSGIFERRWPTLRQERSQPGMSLRCSEQRLHQGRLVNSFNEIWVEVPLQLASMPSTEQFVFNHVCIVYTLNRNVNSKSTNWDFEYQESVSTSTESIFWVPGVCKYQYRVNILSTRSL